MLIFDSHCHIDAITENSQYMLGALVPSVGLNDILKLVELRYNNKLYKIGFGIHPWFIDQAINPTNVYNALMNKCLEHQPDFIGEIGLDQLKPNFAYQCELFQMQLEIAQKLALPVVIHCVKAYNEVLHIVKQYKISGIIHGFNANHLIAKQFIDSGFLLGIGSLVVKNSQISSAIAKISLDKIVLETDAPFMPAFHQAKSNLSDIFLYAQIVAKKYNLNLIDVINQVNNNVKRLFRN